MSSCDSGRKACENHGGFDPESLAAQRRFVAWTSHTLKPELARLGVDIRKNDFRHTYATYGVAYHQNADLISLQMGHSAVRRAGSSPAPSTINNLGKKSKTALAGL